MPNRPSLTALWSLVRGRKATPDDVTETGAREALGSTEAIADLSAELEEEQFRVAAISGGEVRASSQPSSPTQNRQVSGLHSRLTLQRSQTIYHVGGRETPTESAVTSLALDHLRDLCLRLVGGEERARVICVASEPAARAAKSHVAAQLASMLSGEFGPNVLALEADPGSPALHKALGFAAPYGYGLCEQLERLSGELSGRVSIVQLNQRLAALVASEQSPITPEWQACFCAVLKQLRREHEYIILDGPVVGSEADSAHLQQADGVLFVTNQGTKLTQALASVAEHLPNIPLIRIVEIATANSNRSPKSSWRAGLRKR